MTTTTYDKMFKGALLAAVSVGTIVLVLIGVQSFYGIKEYRHARAAAAAFEAAVMGPSGQAGQSAAPNGSLSGSSRRVRELCVTIMLQQSDAIVAGDMRTFNGLKAQYERLGC